MARHRRSRVPWIRCVDPFRNLSRGFHRGELLAASALPFSGARCTFELHPKPASDDNLPVHQMNVTEFYTSSLAESADVKQRTIDACRDDVLKAIDVIVGAYRDERKVLFCGNGGSAADCQ